LEPSGTLEDAKGTIGVCVCVCVCVCVYVYIFYSN